MFKSNWYYKMYINIVQSAKQRTTSELEYYEAHHIIPRSCGGVDTNCNLVMLTAREHLICHLLLPKILVESKHVQSMIYARNMMLNRNKGIVSARTYEVSKKEYVKSISGDNHWAKSDSFRQQVSKQWDDERRLNFSCKVTGDKHWTSRLTEDENKERAASMRRGLTQDKMRENGLNSTFVTNNPMKNPEIAKLFKKPKHKVICPHCNKEGGKPVMMRYHFEKCKFK